jgi:hypothetical protein
MLETLFETLTALKETSEFEDSGGFRFCSAQRIANDIALELFLVPGDGSNEQQWRIDCSGIREYLLQSEFSDDLCVLSEHPVLLSFTEQVTDVYFYCASPNPIATIGALFECHRELVDDWIPFEKYLNVLPKRLSELLASSSGKLASGPVSLMEAYSRVLSEQGIQSSMLPSRPPKFWDGEQWVVSNIPLRALVFDGSFVVAEKFDARRLGV